jgi:pyruvate formate lyase activating enzyme
MGASEGMVFNIQRYSIDDGPGIRTTVFLKGCPLRCPWCSNPESQSAAPQLQYRYTSCQKCGTCVGVCPNAAIAQSDDGVLIDRSKCTVCGACVKECPAQALVVKGERMTVDQVWKVVRRDATYYETSGGGVTCSGGEILAQPDFVASIFKKCREEGVHTCADTSGFGTREALLRVLEYADLVYYDLKHMDPVLHEKLTGVPLDAILGNLRTVAETGVAVTIRVPLIPEYNNSDENLDAMARAARGAAPDAVISILPYHKYGANKYASVGMTYTLDDLRECTPEELERAQEIFISHGFECTVSK